MTDAPTPLPSAPAPPPRPPHSILGRLAAAVREQNWFAVAVEVAIVVLGVLIALGVNAWWADRQRDADEAALRAELRHDVEATRELLAADLTIHRILEDTQRAVLSAMATAPPGPARDSVLATVGEAIVFDEWSAIDDTYEEALGSGRLALLTDSGLRLALNRYRWSLERIHSAHALITAQYYDQMEPFIVANTAYSDIASHYTRDDLPQGRFSTDLDRLAESRELWTLLSLRLEWEVWMGINLPRADSLAADVLDRLDP